ncbi:MAG: hypothetical protein IRZ32_04950 [Solirubrobacteraceae bacterium]|nr:hypothetical protein [Solirubrobacteraceae bacterium]
MSARPASAARRPWRASRRRPGAAAGAASRAERAVWAVALAAIAGYALDDAFVHREPGTSIADHRSAVWCRSRSPA